MQMFASDDMTVRTKHRKSRAATAMLLALLAVAGCGMEPYEPRNAREEGPEKGLFTESEGEFVIFRQGEAPKSEEAPEETPEEAPEAPRKRGSL